MWLIGSQMMFGRSATQAENVGRLFAPATHGTRRLIGCPFVIVFMPLTSSRRWSRQGDWTQAVGLSCRVRPAIYRRSSSLLNGWSCSMPYQPLYCKKILRRSGKLLRTDSSKTCEPLSSALEKREGIGADTNLLLERRSSLPSGARCSFENPRGKLLKSNRSSWIGRRAQSSRHIFTWKRHTSLIYVG